RSRGHLLQNVAVHLDDVGVVFDNQYPETTFRVAGCGVWAVRRGVAHQGFQSPAILVTFRLDADAGADVPRPHPTPNDATQQFYRIEEAGKRKGKSHWGPYFERMFRLDEQTTSGEVLRCVHPQSAVVVSDAQEHRQPSRRPLFPRAVTHK